MIFLVLPLFWNIHKFIHFRKTTISFFSHLVGFEDVEAKFLASKSGDNFSQLLLQPNLSKSFSKWCSEGAVSCVNRDEAQLLYKLQRPLFKGSHVKTNLSRCFSRMNNKYLLKWNSNKNRIHLTLGNKKASPLGNPHGKSTCTKSQRATSNSYHWQKILGQLCLTESKLDFCVLKITTLLLLFI